MYSAVVICSLMLVTPTLAQEQDPRTQRVAFEVQHELLGLANYGVFDNLAFVVEKGGTVRLLGQVIRPTLKDDAEKKVKRVPGVDTVVNQIEVLPISRTDDAIRMAVLRAIYSTNGLDLYGMQANPPIHIIVKNGNVALEGAVDNQNDKIVAGLKAKGVSGVFEVKNNLRVDR